jgi:hypothetical protein
MDSVHPQGGVGEVSAAVAADRLRGFRAGFYRCLGRRADELFELTDALLCAEGPVRSLVALCLVPEHRRGHGALYDAVNCGTVEVDRLRERLAELPVPRMFGGRIVLAIDATPWLRPDGETCPERLFCHVSCERCLGTSHWCPRGDSVHAHTRAALGVTLAPSRGAVRRTADRLAWSGSVSALICAHAEAASGTRPSWASRPRVS